MSSVEQEIWNIFTFYTLHGNPLDPEHIRATQFVKLCKDCQIIGSTISEADPPLTEADVQVTYTAEVKRTDRVGTLQKMNYNDFLTALMKISIKVYPRSKTVDDAFQRLLMDNVLPLAARRAPVSVEPYLENEDVSALFGYYSDALEQIFQFYATSDKRTARAMVQQAVASGNLTGPYSSSSLTVAGRSPGRATRTSNSMKDALGYAEFLKFASDFDLSSSVILSTLEIGDIYLSSIKAVEPDSTIRKLTFMEFWEALVRCALVAYSKISDATIIDRIRGLFLYMWRAINRSVPRAFTERRNVSTYAGDLLSGAMLFNKRFTAAWAADGYRDYLSPEQTPLESGKTVLTRLLKKGGEGPAGVASTTASSGAGSSGPLGGSAAAEYAGESGVSGYAGQSAVRPSNGGSASGLSEYGY